MSNHWITKDADDGSGRDRNGGDAVDFAHISPPEPKLQKAFKRGQNLDAAD